MDEAGFFPLDGLIDFIEMCAKEEFPTDRAEVIHALVFGKENMELISCPTIPTDDLGQLIPYYLSLGQRMAQEANGDIVALVSVQRGKMKSMEGGIVSGGDLFQALAYNGCYTAMVRYHQDHPDGNAGELIMLESSASPDRVPGHLQTIFAGIAAAVMLMEGSDASDDR